MDESQIEKQERNEDTEAVGIYSEEGRENLIEEEDEITDVDEGFMKGYNESSESMKCSGCGVTLEGHEVIEKDFKEKHYKFCSQHCLTKFEINQEEPEE
jgi:YHS domain-containing protein